MIKDVCFNDRNSTFDEVELRSLRTIFRVMSREYKTAPCRIPGTLFFQASANSTPVIAVKMSIRTGAIPIW